MILTLGVLLMKRCIGFFGLCFLFSTAFAIQNYSVQIPVNDYFKYHAAVIVKDLKPVYCNRASLSGWRLQSGILYGHLILDPHFSGCEFKKNRGFVGVFSNDTQVAPLKIDRITSEAVPVIYARYFIHKKDTQQMPEAYTGIMEKLNPKYIVVNAIKSSNGEVKYKTMRRNPSRPIKK